MGSGPARKGGRFGSFIVTVVASALATLIATRVLVLIGPGANYLHAGASLVR
jgi:hypothetical protein